MTDLTTLQSDVSSQTTVVNSVVTLLNGLSAQLKAALAANDSAAIAALAQQLESNTAALSLAVAQNTPAASTAPTASS